MGYSGTYSLVRRLGQTGSYVHVRTQHNLAVLADILEIYDISLQQHSNDGRTKGTHVYS